MAASRKITRTRAYKGLIDRETANCIYAMLESSIPWGEGVRSKSGFTRMAYAMRDIYDTTLPEMVADTLYQLILSTLQSLEVEPTAYYGCYLNYYRDGADWTPRHDHKNSRQVVISLGASRVLTVGEKSYDLNSGDVIIFGSSMHGVPKSDTKEGRISIALFLNK